MTVQDALTAMVEQLLVSLNGPLAETLDTVAEVVPVLVTVTVCAEVVEPSRVLGKESPPGFTLSTGPGAVPVPERATVSVTPPALTVRAPDSAPTVVGENVTLTVHDPPAAIDEPQLLVSAKLPVVEIDETLTAELVGLETVTLCAALVVPVTAEPKLSALGLACTVEGG